MFRDVHDDKDGRRLLLLFQHGQCSEHICQLNICRLIESEASFQITLLIVRRGAMSRSVSRAPLPGRRPPPSIMSQRSTWTS